jgi:1-acyl-sn-glycerol-3-phosphate acyltransferase
MRAESVETSLSAAPERTARPGVLRPLAIAAQLAAGLAIAGLIFPLASRSTRLALRQRWASGMLQAIGIEMRVEGATLAPGGLLLANHVSWLDVLVLAAHTPATFVAKSEVRRWPAIGWLAERVETVFLRRASGRSLLQVKNRIAGLLRAGRGVALFPEATTSDGRGVLPFRSGLVQAAVDADRPVQPIAIAYDDEEGRPSASAAFIDGMTLWNSIFSICGAGPITARLAVGAPLLPAGRTRKQLAREAHDAVAVLLEIRPRS